MKTFSQFNEDAEIKPVAGAIGTDGALKYVVKCDDNEKGAYALISRHTGKPLRYFDTKPTQAEADKALGEIEAFKH